MKKKKSGTNCPVLNSSKLQFKLRVISFRDFRDKPVESAFQVGSAWDRPGISGVVVGCHCIPPGVGLALGRDSLSVADNG